MQSAFQCDLNNIWDLSQEMGDKINEQKHLDFLDLLLSAKDEETGEMLDDESIREEVDTFMVHPFDFHQDQLPHQIALVRGPRHDCSRSDMDFALPRSKPRFVASTAAVAA